MITEYLIDKSNYKSLLNDISFEALNGLRIEKRSTKYEGKENFIFRLSVKEESIKGAEALAEISEKVKGIFNKNAIKYRVLTNESSRYFVKELYPLVCAYETKLRNLIHSALFDVNQEVDTAILSKLQKAQSVEDNKKIKNWSLLELSDLGAIIDFLFSNEDLVADINRHYKNNRYLSRAELLDYIQKSDKHTIWEEFFEKDFSDSLIPSQLNEIKSYRNDVMHFHDISYERYMTAKTVLTDGIKDLEKQIKKKIVIEDTPENVSKLADHSSSYKLALSNLSSSLFDITSSLAGISSKYNIDNIIKPLSSLSQAYEGIFSPGLKELGKTLSSIYPSSAMNVDMPTLSSIALGLKPYSLDGLTLDKELSSLCTDQNALFKDISSDNHRKTISNNDNWKLKEDLSLKGKGDDKK